MYMYLLHYAHAYRQYTCICTYMYMYMYVQCIYMYMYTCFNERWEGRKKEASKVKRTKKAKQHSTPKAVVFRAASGGTRTHDTLHHDTLHPKQSFFELPRVGLEPTTLYTLHSRQSTLTLPLSYQGSSAGWAQISHLIVHLMNRLTINSV